jgi:beta-glucosidase
MRALPVIHSNCREAQLGTALDYRPYTPASPSFADRVAAWWRRHQPALSGPVSCRGFPEDMRQACDDDLQVIRHGDVQTAATPIDFLGLDNYFRNSARSNVIDQAENSASKDVPNHEFTEMGWEVYRQGMYEILGQVHFGYGFQAYCITENGAAVHDQAGDDGGVEEPMRVSDIQRHLGKVLEAIAIGVPAQGYFVWSFLDDFEWNSGTARRFGLIQVNYRTQERTPNASAEWDQQVIGENAIDQPDHVLPSRQGRLPKHGLDGFDSITISSTLDGEWRAIFMAAGIVGRQTRENVVPDPRVPLRWIVRCHTHPLW